jgi:hypothetical protein
VTFYLSQGGRSSLTHSQISSQNGWIQACGGINELPNHWVMYFDGSFTLKGAGANIVLIPPEGDILKYAIQLEFLTTNNITEYKGLVNGLQLAKDLGI